MQHQALPHQEGGNDQPVHLVSHPHAVQDQHAADQVAGASPMQAKDVANDRGDVSDAAADAYGLPYGTVANLSNPNEASAGHSRIGAPPDAPISAQSHGAHGSAMEVCSDGAANSTPCTPLNCDNSRDHTSAYEQLIAYVLNCRH